MKTKRTRTRWKFETILSDDPYVISGWVEFEYGPTRGKPFRVNVYDGDNEHNLLWVTTADRRHETTARIAFEAFVSSALLRARAREERAIR